MNSCLWNLLFQNRLTSRYRRRERGTSEMAMVAFPLLILSVGLTAEAMAGEPQSSYLRMTSSRVSNVLYRACCIVIDDW